VLKRALVIGPRCAVVAKKLEPFLGKREKDIFLAGKVAVDGAGTVLDLVSNLPHGHIRIALCEEQCAGGVQNRPSNRLALSRLTLSNAHLLLLTRN